MSTPAEIEIFLPPPEPPVVLGSPDDAWALCAAVHADGDALLAVLSDGDRRVTAMVAAGQAVVVAALDDLVPLVRVIEAFETVTVHAAVASTDAELLVERLGVELWPHVVTVTTLPPLPDVA